MCDITSYGSHNKWIKNWTSCFYFVLINPSLQVVAALMQPNVQSPQTYAVLKNMYTFFWHSVYWRFPSFNVEKNSEVHDIWFWLNSVNWFRYKKKTTEFILYLKFQAEILRIIIFVHVSTARVLWTFYLTLNKLITWLMFC